MGLLAPGHLHAAIVVHFIFTSGHEQRGVFAPSDQGPIGAHIYMHETLLAKHLPSWSVYLHTADLADRCICI